MFVRLWVWQPAEGWRSAQPIPTKLLVTLSNRADKSFIYHYFVPQLLHYNLNTVALFSILPVFLSTCQCGGDDNSQSVQGCTQPLHWRWLYQGMTATSGSRLWSWILHIQLPGDIWWNLDYLTCALAFVYYKILIDYFVANKNINELKLEPYSSVPRT